MHNQKISGEAFFWALQGVCSLHRRPFSSALAQQQLAAPYTIASFSRAILAYGFDALLRKTKLTKLHKESFPLIAWLTPKAVSTAPDAVIDTIPPELVPAMLLQVDAANVLSVEADDAAPRTLSLAEFNQRFSGHITRVTLQADLANDPDSEAQVRQARKFGFSWFVPELLKHKKLWQEVLLASLVI